MTFRHALIVAVTLFVAYEIHVANVPGNAENIGELSWLLFVVLIIPLQRFTKEGILVLINAWRGKKADE